MYICNLAGISDTINLNRTDSRHLLKNGVAFCQKTRKAGYVVLLLSYIIFSCILNKKTQGCRMQTLALDQSIFRNVNKYQEKKGN